jgi:cytochrome P450
MVLRPDATFARWRRRYGDVFRANTLMNGPMVVLCDPAAIKEVFTGPPDVLSAGQANAVLEPVVGDRSVLLLDGAEHLRQRKLLLPPFHGERMRAYETIMREAADRDIDTWPVGRPFALRPHMQAITLDVITRAVFGLEAGEEAEELKRRLRHMMAATTGTVRLIVIALSAGLLGLQGSNKRFAKRVEAADELLYAMIARRRAEADLGSREDICSMLIEARDEDGEPMTDREIRDELMTLLLAGHETTATELAWAFERLLRNPGVRTLLEDELERGDDSYLDAVIKETLRARPVLPNVARVLQEPFTVGGYELPAGLTVVPNINVTHQRSELYPHPGEFRPERFLDGGPDTYTWLPFGGGRRRCIGAAFALFEMRVVIRAVLERTALEPSGRRAESVKRNGFLLLPSRGARAIQRTPPLPARSAAAAQETVTA